ncbi:AAC(3) family N-acetyltransferase [Acrocarpospora pleiomorpha]|uniref:Aminoglycoside N(3)-acetyltransferase n=1 Tax=Acrocarpospora pleiomorpha TaxID=90975 RepID=A0A5M3XIU3_9ACTN|nr:AAC(3) family N-acetyltransferase [Acrocarpospora pleiomorpha]GES21395.1 AAC(3) family N-acetyltransferase [Acrocarpospora pleiomorpha]
MTGLRAGLRALGLRAGQTVLVHASLRRLGPVPGGAAAVVAALREVLGPDGTLVAPAFTANNSDTSPAFREATASMTAAETDAFRRSMPAFDPATTPPWRMGRIAEEIWALPGSIRSGHAQTSFSAIGPLAAKLTDAHAPDCHLGERSPLSRLNDVGAHVLLLGVGFEVCTAFHLAEYRHRPDPPTRLYRCVTDDGEGPRWQEYRDVVLHDGDFAALGAAFTATGSTRMGMIGHGSSHFFPLTTAVDFAITWMRRHRAPE